VQSLLNKVHGGLLVSPSCKMTVNALAGGYHYKRMNIRGTAENIYAVEPMKNLASHIADALQYAALHIISGHDTEQYRAQVGVMRDELRKVRQVLSRPFGGM